MRKSLSELSSEINKIVRDGSLEALKMFIEKNAIRDDVNDIVDHNGLTPYLKAAECGKIEIYDYLAKLPNFNPRRTDDHGLDSLFLAMLREKTEMFDHLIVNYDFDIHGTKPEREKYKSRLLCRQFG